MIALSLNRTKRWFALAVVSTLAFANSARAEGPDDLQLMYPDNNVSSRPIVEFRYRKTDLENKTLTHAFVVMGRELDNGTTVFFGAAGFYPQGDDNKLKALKNVFSSPGHVDYTIADMHSDDVFRVNITGEQENAVGYLIKSWDEGEYELAGQNCTSLVKSVGGVLGLDTGFAGALELMPSELIMHLKMENDPNKPLRHSLAEWERAAQKIKRQRASMTDLINRINQRRREVAESMAQWASWQRLHSQWTQEYNNSVKPTVTINPAINLFPPDDPLSALWPWPPPSPLKIEPPTPKNEGPVVDQIQP